MPYRTLPPYRRPVWEQFAGLWMLILMAMGGHGFTFADTLGRLRVGQLIYSSLLMALALAAFAAWWKGARQPELIFMTGLAILSLAHGGALWFLSDHSGVQSGLRIIAAGIGTLSWVGLRKDYALGRGQVAEVVAVVNGRDPNGKG